MKVVIFCGGKGIRLKELTEELPKPLVEIGNMPVLWHIMKIYSSYGFNNFILCLGYKGEKIKDYFSRNNPKEWNLILVDTEENSTKAERLKKVKEIINEDDFLVAYGDDVSNVNIKELIEFHKKHRKIVTITAVQLNNPYGTVEINKDNTIKEFKEKPLMKEWINGGFMIFNKKIFDYIAEGDELEKEVFEKLVKNNEISAFKHKGFWKSMNTLKDNEELNELWKNGKAEWKIW